MENTILHQNNKENHLRTVYPMQLIIENERNWYYEDRRDILTDIKKRNTEEKLTNGIAKTRKEKVNI